MYGTSTRSSTRPDLAVALAVGAALAVLSATVADVSEPESAKAGG
jgi:hypothetical protein